MRKTGFMQYLIVLIAIGVSLLLASSAAVAKYSGSSVQISPSSVEGQNVQMAADFIRRMGDTEKADNIEKWLKDGKIYWDPTLKENADTGTWTKDITISPSMIRNDNNAQARSKPFDPDKDFGPLVHLAEILFHEKIHAHQSWAHLISCGFSQITPVVGFTQHETEAWIPTLGAVDKWVNNYYKEYLDIPDDRKKEKLEKLNKLLELAKFKISDLGSFRENDCYGLSHDTIDKWIKDMEEFQRKLEAEKTALEKSLASGTFKSRAPEFGIILKHEQEEEFALVRETPKIPHDEEISTAITGRGVGAGEALDLRITNRSEYPLKSQIPVGAVFLPSDGRYQKMIVGEDTVVECPPDSTVTIPLHAYCLDHGKKPPPKPEEGISIDWSVPDNVLAWMPLERIVRAGNRLAREGKFSQKIQQDQEKYRTEVVQRALWYATTKGTSEEVNKETMKKDIDEQIAKFPKEQQPGEKEKKQVVDQIWEHVDLTLKEAEKSKSK